MQQNLACVPMLTTFSEGVTRVPPPPPSSPRAPPRHYLLDHRECVLATCGRPLDITRKNTAIPPVVLARILDFNCTKLRSPMTSSPLPPPQHTIPASHPYPYYHPSTFVTATPVHAQHSTDQNPHLNCRNAPADRHGQQTAEADVETRHDAEEDHVQR